MASKFKKTFLYEKSTVTNFIPKLKPAFEQEIFEDKAAKFTNPDDIAAEDLNNLTVSNTTSCSTCGVSFENIQDQREHFKLDWHRFNIANKLKGQKPINEEQFEAQIDNLSLSGSESDDELDSEEDKLAETTYKHPKVFYTHSETNQLYSIHKAILPDFETKSTTLQWAVFMLGGGHFAGGIFNGKDAILHKTFHCYTVRAKQGGAQSGADNRSGSSHPKSAGASLRRYNEASLAQHVLDILGTWKSELEKCSLIFYRAVSGNRKILFAKNGKDPAILNREQFGPRLVSIPFPTRRATFNEVKRVHEILMTIELHKETVEEMRAKLITETETRKNSRVASAGSNSKSSWKNKNIHRSKSRETPKRELPDFVQELANQAAEYSDSDDNNDDLTEFETSVFKKSTNKKKSTPPPKTDHTIELQNSLVTAVKTNDMKLFKILYDTSESKVLIQLTENFGESKFTLLHIAAREGHTKMILHLLELGADPTVKDKFKKTPYNYCPDKPSRTAFRRYQALYPDQWDYVKANLPTGPLLTAEEEARIANKKAQKKKAQKAIKKEKEEVEKKKLQVLQKESEERNRFLNLSDREKRALAAEKRLLAQNQELPSAQRCFQCGIDIGGKIPFEYLDNRFCTPKCVKEHRKSDKK